MKFPTLFLVFCTFALFSRAVNAAAAPSVLSAAQKILGVTENATRQDIRKAFQKKSFTLHPDKRTGVSFQQATEEWRPIQEAYEVLMKAEQANYDKLREEKSNQEAKRKNAERQASIKKELDDFLKECDAIEKDKNYDEELLGADLKELKHEIQEKARIYGYTVGLYPNEEFRLENLKEAVQFAPFTKQIKIISAVYTLLGDKKKQQEIRAFEERVHPTFTMPEGPIAELIKGAQPELEELQKRAQQDFVTYLSGYQTTDQFKSQLAALREKVAKEQQLTREDVQALEKIKKLTSEEREKELAKYNKMLEELRASRIVGKIFPQELSRLNKLGELTLATLPQSTKVYLERIHQKAFSLTEKMASNNAFKSIVTELTDSIDSIINTYSNITKSNPRSMSEAYTLMTKLLGFIRKKSMVEELLAMNDSQIAARQGNLLAALPLLKNLADTILQFITDETLASSEKKKLEQFIAILEGFDLLQPESIKQLKAAIQNVYDLKFDKALTIIPATPAAPPSKILLTELLVTVPERDMPSSRETIQAITVFNQQLMALTYTLAN